ncbi:hypothetical protein [Agrobacterium vaccinii]|uniref:hypothetical protein n=1 Tax=Agrobacterium vaccinii TaxID=2735528 RepID=UPI001E489ED8|nr:hypothetical protein [Agrobacterium vaccinii]
MTNDQESLSDIKMRPTTVFLLNQHGFEMLKDLAQVSNADILLLAGMGGSDRRKLAAALDRELIPQISRRKKA